MSWRLKLSSASLYPVENAPLPNENQQKKGKQARLLRFKTATAPFTTNDPPSSNVGTATPTK
jgi:hypothetical protein